MMSSLSPKVFGSTLLFLFTMSTSWASGLEEPEVLAPVVSLQNICGNQRK